jgi:membrane associated rhomboid family serine protease
MLENRDYMRTGPAPLQLTLTLKLIIFLVVAYVIQCICDVHVRPFFLEQWLALTPQWYRAGWVWQLLTFQFLHANLLHLFLNMLMLWWVGTFCEQVLGRTRYLVAFFGTGIIGGLLQGILVIAFPNHFPLPVVGASAGVCGVMAIWALLEREGIIRFNFVLPMRAIVFLYVTGAISLFFTLVPTPRESVAHAAHLGGLLAGVAWIKLGWHRDYIRLPWERLSDAWRERRSRRPVRLPRPTPAMASAVSKSAAARKETVRSPVTSGPTEFISKEVDPILDKIAAHGIHSLTEEEKKVLASAKARMEKP